MNMMDAGERSVGNGMWMRLAMRRGKYPLILSFTSSPGTDILSLVRFYTEL
jgi:hypothetical protein